MHTLLLYTYLLHTEGKAGSLVDSYGRFYKPLQVGPRGKRERIFYETLAACLRAESAAEQSSSSSSAAGSDDSAVEQSYMHDSSASPSSPAEDSFQTGVVDAGPRLHAWHNTFSVRNAALLNVVPRFCTCWGAGMMHGSGENMGGGVPCTYDHTAEAHVPTMASLLLYSWCATV